jgi:hypothetical protein
MRTKSTLTRMFVVTVLGASVGVAAPACGAITLQHCWWNDGDETCRAIFEDRPYCSTDANRCDVEQPYGCVRDQPVDPSCYSPCGSGMSQLETAECGLEAGTSDATGTEPEPDMQSHMLDHQVGD